LKEHLEVNSVGLIVTPSLYCLKPTRNIWLYDYLNIVVINLLNPTGHVMH
jgi:hypothetical protein